MANESRPPAFGIEAHAYRAGWTRVLLGVFALGLAPLLIPELGRHRPVFAAYIVVALAMQWLIRRGIGGDVRAVGGGVIDIALVTYLVQCLGSVSSFLVAMYVVLGIIMALVHRRRVAWVLAAISALAYAGVLFAEVHRWLPYAPDARRWVSGNPPDAGLAISSALFVALLIGAATTTVSELVGAIHAREDELLQLNRQLAEISQRDALTQLYNRRRLVEVIDRELERVRRGHSLAVLMVDLDNFKRVNDARGHVAGDDVLCAIASTISANIRATDVAGRYGGDEFVVVLPDSDLTHANLVAGRLVSAVRDAASQQRCAVTASIGIADARADDDVRGLLRRADDSAYRAKQRGGNGIAVAA